MWKIFFHLPISLWCLFIDWTAPDIDNNGFLDSNDFECMALRACVIEGRGDCNPAKLAEYQHIMRNLWDEISNLADFDKVTRFTIMCFWLCRMFNSSCYSIMSFVLFLCIDMPSESPLITTNLDWFDMFTNCRPNFFFLVIKRNSITFGYFFFFSRINHFTGWQNLNRGIQTSCSKNMYK